MNISVADLNVVSQIEIFLSALCSRLHSTIFGFVTLNSPFLVTCLQNVERFFNDYNPSIIPDSTN